MTVAIVFADEPSLPAKAELHKARIADDDCLKPQQLFKRKRVAPCFANGVAPSLDAVLRRALAFNGIA